MPTRSFFADVRLSVGASGVKPFRLQDTGEVRRKRFEWLDRFYVKHDDGLIFMKDDPLLKSLHNDPRFAALEEAQPADLIKAPSRCIMGRIKT